MQISHIVRSVTASFAVALVVVAGGAAIVGCDDKPKTAGDAAHDAGNKMEHAADKVGDKTKDAADKVGDKASDAADKVKDASHDAANNVRDAAK